MFTILLTERGILSVLSTKFFDSSGSWSSDDLQIVKERHAADLVVYSLTMALTVFLSLIALTYAITFVFYIPLPDGICDRLKIQILEQLLRVSNEYMGDLVEYLFGTKVRNSFTRCIIALAFLFKHRVPKWVTVRKYCVANVPVRLYVPKKIKSEGLIFYIHGGGFAVMKPGYYDSVMYMLIKQLGIRIISVDYRLSPENTYPAAVEDCEAVYVQLVLGKVKCFEFDKNRICLMGDSAGGNLATVLAQRILKKNLPKSKCQVLVYPVIHAFDFQSPSYQLYYKEYKGTALLNPRMMARWYLLYLGIPATKTNIKKVLQNQHMRREQRESDDNLKLIGHSNLPAIFLKNYDKPSNLMPDEKLCDAFERHGYDPDFAPIMGKDLSGLCPAMIVTGGYDILRDEGVLYARHLKSYNIPVVWNHYKAAYHGILNMPYSQQRQQIVDDIVAYIQSQFN